MNAIEPTIRSFLKRCGTRSPLETAVALSILTQKFGRRYDVDMPHPSWNESYASGEPLPWDTGTPDPLLVEMIESRAIAPGRTLEIGCGTGTNAIFLAQHGFDVLGVDISEVAVDKARAKAQGRCRFEVVDFLAAAPAGGPFEFVFDRGCFHVFDDEGERARFARERGGRARRTRLVAEPDRQHRRRAAR